jgi:DNA-binding CsgD family transcriptional regulator
MVGRERELEAVGGALDDADAGLSHTLAVIGEPGIGKTRLLAELAEMARQRGHLVLPGRAAEMERDLPFGPFVDAADDYLASLDGPTLSVLGEERCRELAVVFPAFSPAGGTVIQAERYRSYRAVRRLLEVLGDPRPVTIILDDMHWSDPASIELLCHLVRSPAQGAVLVALGFRPSQVPPALEAGLEAARREGRAEVLPLSPLTPEDCDVLLNGLEPPVRREVYRQSGGVPFYVLELARATERAGAGDVRAAPELGIRVPAAVRTALGAEIRSLGTPERTLLEGAAVVGDPFDLALALTAAEMSRDTGMAVLDQLVRSELIASADVPGRFRFRHPLVRRAVYELTGAGWRISAHDRVATALAAGGSPPEVRAHHVERAAQVGDAEAIAVLAAAGRNARTPAGAARWLQAALRLVDENAQEAGQALELKADLALALGLAGRVDEAHSLLSGLLRDPRLAHGMMRARLNAFCANVEHHLGRMEDANARLVEALDAVPDRSSTEAALLMMELCFSFLLGARFAEAGSLAGEALDVARQLGERSLIAAAAAQCFFVSGVAPYRPPPAAQLDDWATLTDELTDVELAAHLDGPLKLGQGEMFLDRLEGAARHFQRGIDVARTSGQGQTLWIMLVVEVLALVPLGRLAEAVEAADDALEASRLSGSDEQMAWALAARCLVATARGEVGLSLALEGELRRLGYPKARRPFFAAVGSVLPEALLEAGEPERARRMIAEVLAEGDDSMVPAGRVRTYEVATRIELALGRRDEAAAWASSAETLAGSVALTMPVVLARRATAAVLMAAGDHHRAARLAGEAATAADRIGAKLEASRALLLAGSSLAKDRACRNEAIELLMRAEVQLGTCGAGGYRAQAARELRGLGRRVGPGSGSGPGSLTEREREVAQLAAAGKSSREIGAQLFVSPKTVETHLAHVFSKLGVSSRRAIASALGRTELPRS